MFGYPAKPHVEEFRIQAALKRLPQLLKQIKKLSEKIEILEKKMRE
jgi:UDP-3-O-[3-hydroxymyristoyl] glucosamine N-acyltransferase